MQSLGSLLILRSIPWITGMDTESGGVSRDVARACPRAGIVSRPLIMQRLGIMQYWIYNL
ncbi:hypothetical protein IQ17_07080 [Bradyrhizobium daqingense]|uniref:Uncharacterized protein n=1 Tax=Bradyrhizobium daqingense TaxID=993502 RepID=A0A562KC54_9BRAD|nr:hypothetical protein IQ17_07080 [Bradyrhizobium daqingense]